MPFTAYQKARLYDTGVKQADTDLLNTDVSLSNAPAALLITVAVASPSTLVLREDVDGAVQTYTLNAGAQLGAGELYSFEIPVGDAGTYNVRVGSGVAVMVLDVVVKPLGAKQ